MVTQVCIIPIIAEVYVLLFEKQHSFGKLKAILPGYNLMAEKSMQNKLTERFAEALVFAFQLHAAQKRKASQVPYFAHLMSVCAIVLEYGGDEDQAIAALLHDAVEDQGGKKVLTEIEQRFGYTVAEIVQSVSDSDKQPKPPWKERKVQYLEHLPEAPEKVWLISQADKLHNLRDILATYRIMGEKTWERFRGGKEGTLWYYRSLVTFFRDNGNPSLGQELERVFAELERLISENPA
jgi:GTP pyrophosphokinase